MNGFGSWNWHEIVLRALIGVKITQKWTQNVMRITDNLIGMCYTYTLPLKKARPPDAYLMLAAQSHGSLRR